MAEDKCCNCDQAGTVLIDDPGANPLWYCDEHLPVHYAPRVAAGHFTPKAEVKESEDGA